jgi:predicted nucleic acid-binding protein
MSVTLVIDTSFVLAYANGSLAAGELLGIVTEDGDTVVLPAATLGEAYSIAKPDVLPMLRLLTTTVGCLAIAPVTADTAPEVGAHATVVSWGDAHAVQLALDYDVNVATADRLRIEPAFPDGWDYIEI